MTLKSFWNVIEYDHLTKASYIRLDLNGAVGNL